MVLPIDNIRNIWLRSQRLQGYSPEKDVHAAVLDTIKHLGYVQIDTISVIERAHHHILWSRVPSYRPAVLTQLQSEQKKVFEYWGHALAYIHVDDFLYFVGRMKAFAETKNKWFASVTTTDEKRMLQRILENGPLSIQEVKDDVLVDKQHEWASRKPSKLVLEYLFYCGKLAIAARRGMIKQYELTERHFGWKGLPKPASEQAYLQYILERSLRAQGAVSLDSVAFLNQKIKPALLKQIEKQKKQGDLIELSIKGLSTPYWIRPETLDTVNNNIDPEVIHILSPFDPLVIQRKRLKSFFDYEHIFEAYIPKDKRRFGYFALPVLAGHDVVALLDLKTDRMRKEVLIQKWSWIKGWRSAALKQKIENKLEAFEQFQLAE